MGATELKVVPGVIDEQAVELFLYSDCLLLAAAIRDRTGWPLSVAEQYPPGKEEWSWAHAGVRTPDGKWPGIHGPRSRTQVYAWLAAFGCDVRIRALEEDPSAWPASFGHPEGAPSGWWRAKNSSTGVMLVEKFADTVLDLYRVAQEGAAMTAAGVPAGRLERGCRW